MAGVLKKIFFLLFMLALFLWYFQSFDVPKMKRHKISIDTKTRYYYLSSFASRLKGKKAPLVIFLHGMNKRWPDKNSTKLNYEFIDAKSKVKKFIAVFPKGTLGACDWGNKENKKYYCWQTKDDFDRAFIRILKNKIEKEYQTDPKKAYLVGFSNGGYFVVSYMFRHHIDDFAGYGVHSGGGYLFKDDPIKKYDYDKKFLVSLNVGKDDKYQFDLMKNLKKTFLNLGWKSDRNLHYSEFDGVHNMDKYAFERELLFFLGKD